MRTDGVPGKGSLEALSRLRTGPYAIDRASEGRTGFRRGPGLAGVSACAVRNSALCRSIAAGIIYIAASARRSTRSRGWGLASRVMSKLS
jgi:hypothetical protein